MSHCSLCSSSFRYMFGLQCNRWPTHRFDRWCLLFLLCEDNNGCCVKIQNAPMYVIFSRGINIVDWVIELSRSVQQSMYLCPNTRTPLLSIIWSTGHKLSSLMTAPFISFYCFTLHTSYQLQFGLKLELTLIRNRSIQGCLPKYWLRHF